MTMNRREVIGAVLGLMGIHFPGWREVIKNGVVVPDRLIGRHYTYILLDDLHPNDFIYQDAFKTWFTKNEKEIFEVDPYTQENKPLVIIGKTKERT